MAGTSAGRYKSGWLKMEHTGYRDLRWALDKLTKEERVGMRRQIRHNNKRAAQVMADKAKELVPVGPRNKPPSKHLKGAIRNVSTDRTIKVIAGNKNVWWGWMVHAGSTDIKGFEYPPGQPFFRDAIRATYKDMMRIHERGMDKVIASWNADQRKAFSYRGKI